MALSILTVFYAQAQDTIKHKKRFPMGFYTTGDVDIYGLSIGIGSDTYQDAGYTGVYSNGIRIEPISQSLLAFTLLFPIDQVRYPDDPALFAAFAKKPVNEQINGLNLSCGTNAFANVNGVTISAIGQSLKNTNGISLGGLSTWSFKSNGLQAGALHSNAVFSNGVLLSVFMAETYKGNGVQLSVFDNRYVHFTGFQAGLFNGLFKTRYGRLESFTGVQIGLINCTKKLRGLQIGLWNVNEKRSLPFVNW